MKRSLKVKGHKSEFSESNNKEMKNQPKTIMMKTWRAKRAIFFGAFFEIIFQNLPKILSENPKNIRIFSILTKENL